MVGRRGARSGRGWDALPPRPPRHPPDEHPPGGAADGEAERGNVPARRRRPPPGGYPVTPGETGQGGDPAEPRETGRGGYAAAPRETGRGGAGCIVGMSSRTFLVSASCACLSSSSVRKRSLLVSSSRNRLTA